MSKYNTNIFNEPCNAGSCVLKQITLEEALTISTQTLAEVVGHIGDCSQNGHTH